MNGRQPRERYSEGEKVKVPSLSRDVARAHELSPKHGADVPK